MAIPVLKLGKTLLVSIASSIEDQEWSTLRDDLLQRVVSDRAVGVVIDLTAMDTMDSYATRMVDGVARMIQLRGGETFVVGIQPGVAMAMSQLGLRLDSASTALDLEEAVERLAERRRTRADE